MNREQAIKSFRSTTRRKFAHAWDENLYDQIGATRHAIGLLEESKALCRKHGRPFDGQKVSDELSHDFEPSAAANGQIRHKTKSA